MGEGKRKGGGEGQEQRWKGAMSEEKEGGGERKGGGEEGRGKRQEWR